MDPARDRRVTWGRVVSGLAIEAATTRVEVLVRGDDGGTLAHEIEQVGHGHTRRLVPLVSRALAQAGVAPRSLGWVAADLGPGSFTGVRVGLATARGLALASGAALVGASSLASLAAGAGARRALIVPLVPGGARDAYAGFFRTDAEGHARLLAAPRVGPLADVLAATAETRALCGNVRLRFVGPGAARWQEALESAHPGSTEGAHRFEGLSAADLADAARAGLGPASGLPAPGEETTPLYVRSAQAEERVRHQALAAHPVTLRPFVADDVPATVEIERRVFSDPWPAAFFLAELRQPLAHARVAERSGAIIGYSVAWLGAGSGHLGNLAVVEGERRRGVARALLVELLETSRARRVESLTLEVRVSNFAAQALYRAHGFRLAGLRRGYYRDTGEDALVMEWRPGA
ncbi:MAG: tRNA (adenosine(37)-N6)-threonylcarbamoyltransferase complex dimerization subunit type 1 TsaB [Candidatus Eisenbacteria bacterium]